jgi:tetratricopeptide (TPR) repeat protein
MPVRHNLLLLGIAGAMAASPLAGQRPDDQISPKSVELQRKGESLLGGGKLSEAEDMLVTSLVVDPRNRSAYIALARVAEKQRLFGKAIRLTNKALVLEPTDRTALAVQGEAMVQLGATQRAKENLAKLQKLCAGACPEAAVLASAINRGPTVAAAKPPASPKTN